MPNFKVCETMKRGSDMKCSKCGKEINKLNHFYIPSKEKEGYRICIECAKKEKIVTLV
jgi:formylmethanofuran dehydrogenase subunit E